MSSGFLANKESGSSLRTTQMPAWSISLRNSIVRDVRLARIVRWMIRLRYSQASRQIHRRRAIALESQHRAHGIGVDLWQSLQRHALPGLRELHRLRGSQQRDVLHLTLDSVDREFRAR